MLTALRNFCIMLAVVGLSDCAAQQLQGVVRTYYVAADELDWNYMPGGRDGMMGMAPSGYAKAFGQRSLHGLGSTYHKAMYREYTDATFKHLKPSPPYLGLAGPILHAEVGDTIKVVFQNHGTHPYSMHPHGVLYQKPSEGSPYADGVAMADKGGDSVAPGATFTYTWEVPDRAGPGPSDPSSIAWLYHSHVNERQDVNSGLVGAIVVTRRGMANPDGTPKDVDKEFAEFFDIIDENESWFIKQNIARFALDPKNYDKLNTMPVDPRQGNADILIGVGSIPTNFRDTINGYMFADGPRPTMSKGDHVRWYVMSIGEGFNFHTPHWHGNTVLVNGARTDVLSLAPAQMITADMVADNPGRWLFHCHVSDHMESGMVAMYDVKP